MSDRPRFEACFPNGEMWLPNPRILRSAPSTWQAEGLSRSPPQQDKVAAFPNGVDAFRPHEMEACGIIFGLAARP